MHDLESKIKQQYDYNRFDILNVIRSYDIWRPPSLRELTPMIFNTGLTHLDSEASIYSLNFKIKIY